MEHVDPLVTKDPAALEADPEDSTRISVVAAGFAVCAVITLLIAAIYHHRIAGTQTQGAAAVMVEDRARMF